MDSLCSTVNPNIWILTSSGVLMLFFPFWYLSIIKLQATQWTRECNWFEIKAKWLRGLIVQAGQSEKKVNKHFVIHDENQIGVESNSANFLQAKFSSVSLAGACVSSQSEIERLEIIKSFQSCRAFLNNKLETSRRWVIFRAFHL